MHSPLIAEVVHKDILVDVQVVLTAVHLADDGAHGVGQRVLPGLVLPVAADVAAVDGLWSGAAEVAWQAGDLVLGELRRNQNE